jgi:hypothetical protein
MAFRLWAAVWLAFQLARLAAFAADDSEGCTPLEEPDALIGESALLQAAVGKEKVLLTESVEDLRDQAAAADLPVGKPKPEAAVPEDKPAPSALQQKPLWKPLADADASDSPAPEAMELLQNAASDANGEDGASWLQPVARFSVLSMSHFVRERLPDSWVTSFPSLQTDIGAAFGLLLVTWLIWYILVMLTASVYRSNKAFPVAVSSRPEQDFNDWTSGPFDCSSENRGLLCWSCCCPCIRWADNMDMLGIVGFWVGLLLFCGLALLITVPGGVFLWAVATLLSV